MWQRPQRLDSVLHPDHLSYLRDVRTYGMAARFQGVRSRSFARLHPNARRQVDQVYAQIAKDLKKPRVLAADSKSPALFGTVAGGRKIP